MIKALLVAANGCEEIETITTYDLLKRANIDVTIASINENSTTIEAAHGLKFNTDTTLEKVKNESYDVIILPGGLPGSEYLRDCNLLIDMIKQQQSNKKWIAAICAAPGFVLGTHKLEKEAHVTSYPSTEKLFSTGIVENKNCVVDCEYKIITAQGPAFAFDFGLAIISALLGDEAKHNVAKPALYKI